MQKLILNSGQDMPIIGFGTAAFPFAQPEEIVSAVLDAIRVGYRHFDTAAIYNSEEPLGKAVAEAIDSGLISSRDELFITSKLWCTDAYPSRVVAALKESLRSRKLGMEYLDLYLIHYPLRLRPETSGLAFAPENILPFDLVGMWKAMEDCQKLGLAKSIGVSNYSVKKLKETLEHCSTPPSVNQVEMNVAWQQLDLLTFCREKGISLCAWGPLGGNGTPWGSNAVMDDPVLNEIATAKGKSVAQIALRWVYQQGVTLIVKSFHKDRMTQNLQVPDWDWELSEDELVKIKQDIPQRRGNDGSRFGAWLEQQGLWDE
ncbi:unnamed protein product [Rhodiola kirilowii]